MCEIETDDYATVWRDSRVKAARKTHRCDSCGRTINVGESYGLHFSVFDGHPHNEKACVECDDARLEFGRDEHHFTPMPSGLGRMLGDCVDGGDGDSTWVAMLDNLQRRRRAAKAEGTLPGSER